MVTQREYVADFADFIEASPTSYHAVSRIASRLDACGFTRLREEDSWLESVRGGGFYVIRGGAVIAFMLPEEKMDASRATLRIIGSHTDSPCLKVKPEGVSFHGAFTQVDVEVYGGPLLNSWLNRDMGIAGRVVDMDGNVHLVKTPACMVLPQLAPHLIGGNRDKLEINRQKDIHPVYTRSEDFWDLIAGSARPVGVQGSNASEIKVDGLRASDIAGHDLHSYCVEPPHVNGSYFSSGRQDNLVSVFASMRAMEDCARSLAEGTTAIMDTAIPLFVAFDHEEVGSGTSSGACGPFLESILRRIIGLWSQGEEAYERICARSLCVSADTGHSLNPNYPEHYDPDYPPVAGEGVLIKINALQRYASDAYGIAMLRKFAQSAGAKLQSFVSNNAIPCGTTTGPLTATRLGIPTVDVGIPLLSMHSAREISHVDDLYTMYRLCAGVWGSM